MAQNGSANRRTALLAAAQVVDMTPGTPVTMTLDLVLGMAGQFESWLEGGDHVGEDPGGAS